MTNSPEDQDDIKSALVAAMGDAAAEWLVDLDDDDISDAELLAQLSAESANASNDDQPQTNHGGQPMQGVVALDAVLDDLASQLQSDSSQPSKTRSMDSAESNKSNVAIDVGPRHAVFEVGDQQFGIPLSGVREIDRCGKVTALPRTPVWLRGVTNLRGKILSVTDFRRLLDLADAPQAAGEKIIVVHSERHNAHTALVVDRVLGIRNLKGEQDPLAGLSGQIAKFADSISVTDQTTTVLIDPDQLLGCDELSVFAAQ